MNGDNYLLAMQGEAMDLGLFLGPAVVAALVSGIITTIGFFVAAATSTKLHRERLGADEKLAERKVEADISLAERKYRLDREMADWKRRSEFAEEVLADFYKARTIFASARTPFARAGEGATRPLRNGETEASRNAYKDAIFTPLERLTKESDFLNGLVAKRFRFAALFGSGADQAFGELVGAYNEVSMATTYLLQDREYSQDRQEKYEAAIGWDLPENDDVAKKLDEVVCQIERVCVPVLKLPAPSD